MEIASTVEVLNGSNDTKAVTPRTLSKKLETYTTGGGGGDTTPIGIQLPYVNATPPTGWLICDGSAISRTTYPDLFAVIGTSYGVGDGSTTFNLPDKRGRVSVGLDPSITWFNVLAKKGGKETVTLGISHIPSHGHNYRADGYNTIALSNLGWVTTGDFVSINQGGGGYRLGLGASVQNTGGGQAHNNLQPYEVDVWIIKAFNGKTQNPVSGNVNDTMPVGGIIPFDGTTIPEGYEEVNGYDNYSTEEQVIGTWIDGKPLYRKMVEFGSMDSNTTKQVAHGIQNAKCVFVDLGHSYWVINSETYDNPTRTLTSIYQSYIKEITVNRSNIIVNSATVDASTYKWLFCLEYTKTTD